MQPSTLRAYLLLVVVTACWGLNAVLGRLAVGEVSPMMLTTLRWTGVVLLLGLFARQHVVHDWPQLRKHLPLVIAMGALGFTLFNGLFYIAAQTTTALNIGILQGSIPIFVVLGVWLVYRAQPSALQLLGVAITLAGVMTVASAGDIDVLLGLDFRLGDLLMLLACALYASYAVALRARPPGSALGLFTLMSAVALVVALPLLGLEAYLGKLQWPTPKGWLVVVLATALPSFLAQVFFIQGVSILGPSRAGVFVNLVPVFAALLAVLILGEAFRAWHAIALTLVLGGIWVAEHGKPVEG